MSFKRLDPEDIVLSSELVTTPTWYSQEGGDTATIRPSLNGQWEDLVPESNASGESLEYYTDFYSTYTPSGSNSGSFDKDHSKCMMSVALAKRPVSGSQPTSNNIIFGQFRSLVLGDEDSEFRFGYTRTGVEEGSTPGCSQFFAVSIDRARFREKIDPTTCRITVGSNPAIVLAPDTTANERYLDSGRVYDIAQYVSSVESGSTVNRFVYPTSGSSATSFGYFLPDIGVILLNAEQLKLGSGENFVAFSQIVGNQHPEEDFVKQLTEFTLRSQETITSNYVFARARNAEFNYSTNPSNITGSAGNIRWGVMINQPQTFITTIGLYNDSNELLAVGKLSKPLVKDFTREALIRLKLDY